MLILQSDLASAMPTAGGLYWWTHHFAGERYKRPFSFLIGYSNTLGLIGGICSVDCELDDYPQWFKYLLLQILFP